MKAEKQKCPICGRKFSDVLKHLVISHRITNMAELQKLKEDFDKNEFKSSMFNRFIIELNEKLKKREITMEEFKRLRDEWWNKN